jgi:hypothetical protein
MLYKNIIILVIFLLFYGVLCTLLVDQKVSWSKKVLAEEENQGKKSKNYWSDN